MIAVHPGSRLQIPPLFDELYLWSLGCVFSEAAIWLLTGYDNLLDYRNARKSVPLDNDEHLLDIVFTYHNKARVPSTSSIFDTMTERVLGMVENDMLVLDGQPRSTANGIWEKCKGICNAKATPATDEGRTRAPIQTDDDVQNTVEKPRYSHVHVLLLTWKQDESEEDENEINEIIEEEVRTVHKLLETTLNFSVERFEIPRQSPRTNGPVKSESKLLRKVSGFIDDYDDDGTRPRKQRNFVLDLIVRHILSFLIFFCAKVEDS
jgi:hypothetical protein